MAAQRRIKSSRNSCDFAIAASFLKDCGDSINPCDGLMAAAVKTVSSYS